MSQDLYHEILLEAARSPQNQGELLNADVRVEETNASCGDSVRVFLQFDESRQRVVKIRWQGSGCIISQAALSLLAPFIEGKTVQEVEALQQRDLEQLLGLETVSPGRVKCLLLGLRAVQRACVQALD